MRDITHIVIHCSATPEGRDVTAKDIDRWHRANGWRGIGYHYVIRLDGTIEEGRPLETPGAHVGRHNATTVGICYIGGVDADDITLAQDTRTPKQKVAMATLVEGLKHRFPDAEVLGHRDFPNVAKACPSFDVREWWAGEEEPRDTPETHKVVPGDTLWGIARKYGVSVDDLREFNLLNTDIILPGLTLRLTN